MAQRQEFIFPPGADHERLDSFLARSLEHITRSTIQKLIEEGMVTVDGEPRKPSLKLRGGEAVAITIPPPKEADALPESIPLDILHEDEHVVVVNKPAGMTVHPGAGTIGGTLVNALLGHCCDLSGIGGTMRPGIVHRIDKGTSGVLVIAKNDAAHLSLSRQFRDHTVKRLYLALVYGSPREDKGRVESVIGRNPSDRKKMSGKVKRGKQAVTNWRVLERYEGVTLLRLRLETGRTHQIRVHLTEAGYPLLGDPVYGSGSRLSALKDTGLKPLIKQLGRQALHAKTLGFLHPATGEYLEFEAPLPDDIGSIIEYLGGNRNP